MNRFVLLQYIKIKLIKYFEIPLLSIGSLFATYPISPGNNPISSTDSGVFLYIGSRILSGDFPYTNVWDHKPPGIFYIDALGLLIGKGSIWGVWVLEYIFFLLSSIILYKIINSLFGKLSALFTIFVWFLTFTFMIDGGNFTTEYTIIFNLACFWIAINSIESGLQNWKGFSIGFLSAISFFIKQNTIAMALSIIIFFFIKRTKTNKHKLFFREILTILTGGLVVTIFIITYFGINGVIKDFWDSAFLFNFNYISSSFQNHINAILLGVKPLSYVYLAQFGLAGWVIGIYTLFYPREKDKKYLSILKLAIINLPLEMILTGVSGRPYYHYYLVLLPIFSFFFALFFGTLIKIVNTKFKTLKAGTTIVVFLYLFIISINLSKYIDLVRYNRNIYDPRPITFLKENTVETDTVLFWGAASAYNFHANRKSPSRFVYQSPLYISGYATVELVEEFLQDIITHKPKYIFDHGKEQTPYMEFNLESKKIDEYLLYLNEHYIFHSTVGGWPMYEFVE